MRTIAAYALLAVLVAPSLAAALAPATLPAVEVGRAPGPYAVEDTCLAEALPCLDLPLLVDEGGDTMDGDLGFAAGIGVAFPAGRLTGDGALAFGGTVVCLAISPATGCGDISAVRPGPGLMGGAESGDATLAVDLGAVQARVAGVCAPGFAIRAIDAAGAVACEEDDDTMYAAGFGLLLQGTVLEVDGDVVQRRVAGACAEGSSIAGIAPDGSVSCEPDTDTLATLACAEGELAKRAGGSWSCAAGNPGTVTSVASGAGLAGGPITGAGTLSIAAGGVTSAMILDGTVQAADLAFPAGDVTGVSWAANSGLTGGGVSGDVVLGTDPAMLQRRVGGTCAGTDAIQAVNQDGSVVCQSAAGWLSQGNALTTPGFHYLGTSDNRAFEVKVNASRVLRLEPGATSPNILGGHSANALTSGVAGAIVAGGGETGLVNKVTDHFGVVGGGRNNTAGDAAGSVSGVPHATVAGGSGNRASGPATSVGGGERNTASGTNATIAGGGGNLANGVGTAIGGGDGHTANGDHATVAGGLRNWAGEYRATVGGGDGNNATGQWSTVAGGLANTASFYYGTVGGGRLNFVDGQDAVVAGGEKNKARQDGAAVLGGSLNLANATDAVVVGGTQNVANKSWAFVGGGLFNLASGSNAVVVGGNLNKATAESASVLGGYLNTASATFTALAGGRENTVSANYATVAGGYQNQATGGFAGIGGGGNNIASANFATVGGGVGNTASGATAGVAAGNVNVASGAQAFVGGGLYNTASGPAATVAGGEGNLASAQRSFAAGYHAQALHPGSFVWNDGNETPVNGIASTAPNQFIVRADGGLYFGRGAFATNIPAGAFIGTSTGAQLSLGGTWTDASDRNLKEHFAPVDTADILAKVDALPLSTWNYRSEDDATRHLGAMAQDFHALFGLGADDTHIAALDTGGVALAAIQGLHGELREKDARIAGLEARLAALEAALGQAP